MRDDVLGKPCGTLQKEIEAEKMKIHPTGYLHITIE